MSIPFEDSRKFAADLDSGEPFALYREEFNFPAVRNGYDPVYLCGNSLGLQPKRARALVERELDNWAELAVDGHFHA